MIPLSTNGTKPSKASFDTVYVGNQAIPIEALRFSGAVEFGSRAFNVHSQHSDYDFAILRSNFEKLFERNKPDEMPIKHYFKVVPPNGNNSIVVKYTLGNNNYLDLLVLEHQEHLDMFKRAVRQLKLIPNTHPNIYIKANRITLFEKELLKQGFRTRWPVAIANWLMKSF